MCKELFVFSLFFHSVIPVVQVQSRSALRTNCETACSTSSWSLLGQSGLHRDRGWCFSLYRIVKFLIISLKTDFAVINNRSMQFADYDLKQRLLELLRDVDLVILTVDQNASHVAQKVGSMFIYFNTWTLCNFTCLEYVFRDVRMAFEPRWKDVMHLQDHHGDGTAAGRGGRGGRRNDKISGQDSSQYEILFLKFCFERCLPWEAVRSYNKK